MHLKKTVYDTLYISYSRLLWQGAALGADIPLRQGADLSALSIQEVSKYEL